ncbi:MAG: hypothetical protein MZV65_17975 [Chromatiales bacterium]|nr:hypothetical protein [Chromatiales bacterium]
MEGEPRTTAWSPSSTFRADPAVRPAPRPGHPDRRRAGHHPVSCTAP